MNSFDIITASDDLLPLPAGSETDWVDVGELDLPSGRLCFGDAACPHDVKNVALPKARYVVALRTCREDGHILVTRARVTVATSYSYDCNVASYGVDSSRMLFGDAETVRLATSKVTADHDEAYFERVMAVKGAAPVILPSAHGSSAWVIETGHGDGLYDLFVLTNESGIIGCETIFIGADPKTARPRRVCKLP